MALWSGVFIPLMTSKMDQSHPQEYNDQVAFYALSLFGVGSVFGGQIFGFFRDKSGNKVALVILMLFQISGVICVVTFIK